MLHLNYRELKPNLEVEKNVLYKIKDTIVIPIYEKHKEDSDIVNLEYSFEGNQYAFLGKEYRNPAISKDDCKMADIMTFLVDENTKKIYSFILDIKKDISAFSDNLLKNDAIITALKEVRDFVKQLHDENIQKNSLLVIYCDENYEETLDLGLATRSFEPEKFIAVADFLEELDELDKPQNMQELLWVKFKTSLKPYSSEIVKLRDFANKKVFISGQMYDLKVFILEKQSDTEYITAIPMKVF